MSKSDDGPSGPDRVNKDNEELLRDRADDIVQPFVLESTNLRGRMVRFGSVVDDILNAHDYPRPIAHLVAETLTLCALLSSMLKYDGIFTLQANGDGPLKMVMADVTSDGKIRACASFDKERLNHARDQVEALRSRETAQNHLAQYLGKGYIAFTVDQGEAHERYQGIVELKGSSLIDCVQHYFNQSEQIKTGIKMAVGERDGKWRSAGIMMQDMPEEGGAHFQATRGHKGNLEEDDWRRSMILLDSCTNDELLDKSLGANEVLYRLFHEEGVRIFEQKDYEKQCRCNQERVESILYSMSEDDLDYMSDDGTITMHCEFCGTDYTYEIAQILRNPAPQSSKEGLAEV